MGNLPTNSPLLGVVIRAMPPGFTGVPALHNNQIHSMTATRMRNAVDRVAVLQTLHRLPRLGY